MGDIIHETTPPLAWDQDGMPFSAPANAVAWKVRRYTGNRGKPGIVWGPHGPTHLDLGATMTDLRAAVGGKPGMYWLYLVTESGEELSHVAHVELTELN